MADAGAYITALAGGGSIDTVHDDNGAEMEERVFGPMGMTSTTFSVRKVQENGNLALAHALSRDRAETEFRIEAEIRVSPVASAGGARANLEDLGRFAITRVNDVLSFDGRTVVSSENSGRDGVARRAD